MKYMIKYKRPNEKSWKAITTSKMKDLNKVKDWAKSIKRIPMWKSYSVKIVETK